MYLVDGGEPSFRSPMVLAGQGSSPCRCFHALGACMTLHLPFGNRHGSAGHRQKDETHARRPRNRPHSFLAKQGRATERCWQMQVQWAVGDVSFAFSFKLWNNTVLLLKPFVKMFLQRMFHRPCYINVPHVVQNVTNCRYGKGSCAQTIF